MKSKEKLLSGERYYKQRVGKSNWGKILEPCKTTNCVTEYPKHI